MKYFVSTRNELQGVLLRRTDKVVAVVIKCVGSQTADRQIV